MVQPLNQFCCGCSLKWGVEFILAVNLVQNLFYILTTVSNIIFLYPTFGYSANLATQTFNCAICLMGVPFIIFGYLGVKNGQETHLRLYLYYAILSFFMDMGYGIAYVIAQDVCDMVPSVMASHGAAFACGAARIGSVAALFMTAAIHIYCIFTVWSLCEDLRCGGCGSGLPDLLARRDYNKTHTSGRYSDGLFGTGCAREGPFPVSYGSVATPGLGGSSRIFNGKDHDTNYPPKLGGKV